MTSRGVRVLGLAVLAGGLLVAGCSRPEPEAEWKPMEAQKPAPAPVPSSPPAARAVPPYYGSAEAAQPFPRLVPGEYFRDYPLVARAYRIAGQIPGVIAQQPCYCYCNKFGHRSLLDCYASDHGAG